MPACTTCETEMAESVIACSECHSLVHADELARLSTLAKGLEQQEELALARETWTKCLALLPPESKQAQWIRTHANSLAYSPPSGNQWAKRLGPLAPLALILAKGKTLLALVFKGPFLISLIAWLGVYWATWGARFAIGFTVLIFVHEMGHYID